MKLLSVLAGSLLVALLTTNAQATVTIVKDTSIVDSIPGLTGYASDGADMDGMIVKATFSSGYSQTLIWADTGATSGGVIGNGWALSVTGDTFGASWIFDFARGNSLGRLVSLVLDATPYGQITTFDSSDPNPGTPDSASGWTFQTNDCTGSCAVTATYSHAVAIGAAAPVGDEFHMLTLQFTNGPGSDWTFIQDTDNDIRKDTGFIPEPGSLALAGLGLAGLLGLRRRMQA